MSEPEPEPSGLKIPPYPFAGSSLDRECPHGWAVWSCHDCNYGREPEPPPDMSGFKMETIRDGGLGVGPLIVLAVFIIYVLLVIFFGPMLW